MDDLSWQAEGACGGMTTDDFFFEGRFSTNSPEYLEHCAMLRVVCNSCPVIALCRDYADRTDTRVGWWGGESSSERYTRRFPNRRKRASITTPVPSLKGPALP